MDNLTDIFQRQAAYVRSLVPTYKENGFKLHATSMPWDLNGRRSQEEFRLLAWRITEEVFEAVETYSAPARLDAAKYHEEVADALHFLVELCLATGITEDEIVSGIATMHLQDNQDKLEHMFEVASRNTLLNLRKDHWAAFLRALAQAMMHLRQRPWRTDYRQTDRRKWILGMHLAFQTFIDACFATGMTSTDLYNAYFNKAEVNDKRNEDFGVKA